MKLLSTLALSAAMVCAAPQARAQLVVGGNGIMSSADFFCSLVQTQVASVSPECGASLIRPQWVLTAGHCAYNPAVMQQYDSIDIVVAPYVRSKGGYTRVRSSKIYIHKDYDISGQGYDIALIKLRTPVTSSVPIKLPAQGDNSLYDDGDTVHVVGFGIHDPGNLGSQPDTLQYAEIKVIGNPQCNVFYGGMVEPDMVCAGMLTGGPKGGAAGDSGGPLFAKTTNGLVQVGVVSWGQGPFTDTTTPGVYTRVSTYRQWIDSIISADSSLSVSTVSDARAEVHRTETEISVTLEDAAAHDLEYILYNYEGRVIRSGTWKGGRRQYSVDARDLQNALYFIYISDKGEYRFTGKVPVLR